MLLINKWFDGLKRWLKVLFSGKKDGQAGITLVEISVGLAVIAFLAVFIAPRVGALFGKTRIELAQQELIMLITASQEYRQERGGYEGINLAELSSGGYHIEPFDGTSPLNTFGESVTIVSASGNKKATLTYPTDGDEACTRLRGRLENAAPAEIAACGTDANVVITIN